MAGQLLPDFVCRLQNASGNNISGGTSTFYLTGTTTLATIYSNATLATSLPNPISTNSAGLYKNASNAVTAIYLDPTVTYRQVIKDASGNTLRDIDPINIPIHSERSVSPDDYSATGDGTANDTTAVQTAIATGLDVELTAGKTYRVAGNLEMTTSHQRLFGSGVLKFDGAYGVIVKTNAEGVKLGPLTFNSSTQTGPCITVNNADRVMIQDINIIDGDDGLYVTEANTVFVNNMWGQCRGYGVKWYGTTAIRSDILALTNVVLDVADTEYGLDWDGNCHTGWFQKVGIVGGKGFIVRNTSGGTAPAIGKFFDCESDYSLADSFRIDAGSDFDFVGCYGLGDVYSGLYVGAAINTGEVRVSGGKYRGHARYGIENAGGPILYSGNADLSDNDLGRSTGSLWTVVSRLSLDIDGNAYITKDGDDPQIVFASTDYIVYDVSDNAGRSFVAGVQVWGWDEHHLDVSTGKQLRIAAGTTARAPINLGAGVAPTSPANGDIWSDGSDLKFRAGGVTYTLTKT
jgi:hypothetical protein